jgi:hypothetical protein
MRRHLETVGFYLLECIQPRDLMPGIIRIHKTAIGGQYEQPLVIIEYNNCKKKLFKPTA